LGGLFLTSGYGEKHGSQQACSMDVMPGQPVHGVYLLCGVARLEASKNQ
jgi:hypothetical protein